MQFAEIFAWSRSSLAHEVSTVTLNQMTLAAATQSSQDYITLFGNSEGVGVNEKCHVFDTSYAYPTMEFQLEDEADVQSIFVYAVSPTFEKITF